MNPIRQVGDIETQSSCGSATSQSCYLRALESQGVTHWTPNSSPPGHIAQARD